MLQAQRAGGLFGAVCHHLLGRTLAVEIVAQGGLAAPGDETVVLCSFPGARTGDNGHAQN
jgi:hypothetical protein